MHIRLDVNSSTIPPALKYKHDFWNLLVLEAQQQMIALAAIADTRALLCKSKFELCKSKTLAK